MFPPLPGWDGLHPLIVHFPIALLLVSPLLILAGLVVPRHRAGFAVSAAILMVLGTASAFVAASTGEAAEDAAERVTGADAVLHEHEELAESTQLVFSVLTALFIALTVVGFRFRQRLKAVHIIAANIVFLVLYVGGLSRLVNTAHQGGRLVHEFGVRAPVAVVAEPAMSNADRVDHDD